MRRLGQTGGVGALFGGLLALAEAHEVAARPVVSMASTAKFQKITLNSVVCGTFVLARTGRPDISR
jgi:hypothetical protein